ncbi:MmgE/PrpD family protein [Rhodovibrionaceae bacterium A322]
MTDQRPAFRTSQDLALWIADSAPVRNPLALQRAKAAFLDTLACLLAGADDPAVIRVASAFTGHAAGCSSAVSGPARNLPSEYAALINGTAAHCLDFDDNFLPAVTHASAVMVPALLALGEEIDLKGSDALDAYIIGLETQAWLGRHSIPGHYAAGWHATSTLGAIGCAAACARLLKLPADQSCAALSIATSMAAGSKVQFGTMTKPLHAGLAARAGIIAARLAQKGVEANQEPLLGPWGFLSLYQGESPQKAEEPDPQSERLAILTEGLTQKRFPCCASAHRTLDGFFTLQAQNGFAGADIAQVHAILPDSNYQNLRFHRPENEKEARFSLHHCLALAALYGRVNLDGFTSSVVEDPALRAFLPKVRMTSAGPLDLPQEQARGIWDQPAVTRVALNDGRSLEIAVRQPVGSLSAPLSPNDLSQKFRTCAQRRLSEQETIELEARIWALEEQDLTQITALLSQSQRTAVPV